MKDPTWLTKEGEVYAPQDMTDSHIAHCVAMIKRGTWRPQMLPVLRLEQAARRAGDPEDAVLGFLWRAWMRDVEKGEEIITGWRTASEVAVHLSLTTREARQRLEALYEGGWVAARQDKPRTEIAWFATDCADFRGWRVRVQLSQNCPRDDTDH